MDYRCNPIFMQPVLQNSYSSQLSTVMVNKVLWLPAEEDKRLGEKNVHWGWCQRKNKKNNKKQTASIFLHSKCIWMIPPNLLLLNIEAWCLLTLLRVHLTSGGLRQKTEKKSKTKSTWATICDGCRPMLPLPLLFLFKPGVILWGAI